MAFTQLSFISSTICLLLLLAYGSLGSHEGARRAHGEAEFQFERIHAVGPTRQVESEAGVSEYWDENQEQFRRAGVAATRHTIQPRGLLLPSFSNAPRLIYVIQGRGISGVTLPGCQESFQSFDQSEQRGGQREHRSDVDQHRHGDQREQHGGDERSEQHDGHREQQSNVDQHQKISRIRQGDILALPAGVAHWFYNDGETPVVAVAVLDTANSANQLDQNPRKFFLAGNQPREGWQRQRGDERARSNNVLSGFDPELLAEAAGVSRETAERLRGGGDERGRIVRVENGLRVVGSETQRQRREEEEEERERTEESEARREEEESEREGGRKKERGNGLVESFCYLRLKENIEDPSRADVHNPHAGRITTLTSHKLPILRSLHLSAERGTLNRNAVLVPHWNINSHSIVYGIRGSARVQIVDNSGRAVFDGELRQGQLVVVPQNFAVVKKARNSDEGFEWVAFKTNGNAIVSPIFGKSSTVSGLPEDVVANSYRIPREEARRLKENRGQEFLVLVPRGQARRAIE